MLIQPHWTHVGPTVLAAFLAALVECVEALTVVLAVGTVRGWRDTLFGSAAALVVLLLAVILLGHLLAPIPLDALRLIVGTLVLLFGLRWLRKAILRSAGVIALHDEAGIYTRQQQALQGMPPAAAGRDTLAFVLAFKAVLLEGTEVVFIVVALSANDSQLLWPTSLGALVALLVVVALGFALHRPLAHIPENTLKFLVGVLLSAFGTFWVGEGLGMSWPGHDMALAALVLGFLMVAGIGILACRLRMGAQHAKIVKGNRT